MQKVTTQEMIVLLNEIREQAVVAMVSHGDSEEYDPIMEMLARKLQVINAIAERVRDMTAVEYFKAKKKMCDVHLHGCRTCQFAASGHVCVRKEESEPHVAVEIVKRWKEEHNND